VSDNGVGIGSGTGLKNIRVRLAGICGKTAVLSVNGLPEGGVAATVQLAGAGVTSNYQRAASPAAAVRCFMYRVRAADST